MLWIIERLPEKCIPGYVVEKMVRYLEKRENELKVEYIQSNWRKTFVEKAAEELKQK